MIESSCCWTGRKSQDPTHRSGVTAFPLHWYFIDNASNLNVCATITHWFCILDQNRGNIQILNQITKSITSEYGYCIHFKLIFVANPPATLAIFSSFNFNVAIIFERNQNEGDNVLYCIRFLYYLFYIPGRMTALQPFFIQNWREIGIHMGKIEQPSFLLT